MCVGCANASTYRNLPACLQRFKAAYVSAGCHAACKTSAATALLGIAAADVPFGLVLSSVLLHSLSWSDSSRPVCLMQLIRTATVPVLVAFGMRSLAVSCSADSEELVFRNWINNSGAASVHNLFTDCRYEQTLAVVVSVGFN